MSLRNSAAVGRAVLIVAAAVGALSAQAPLNDSCLFPTVVAPGINPSAPGGASGSTYSNVVATDSSGFLAVSCAGVNAIRRDLFFLYTASCSGTTTVATCTPPGFAGGTLADTVIEVYPSSACVVLAPPLACNDQACGSLSSAQFDAAINTSYLIRVGSKTNVGGTFYLTVTPPAAPGDDCAAPEPLAVGANSGSTSCATPSSASCAGFPASNADVWRSFTPAANCLLTVTVSGPGADRLGAFSGACGSLTSLDCDASAPYDVEVVATAGVTYLFRVGRSGAEGADASFTITLDCAALGGNDECATPAPIFDGVNPGAPNGASGFTFSNYGATSSAGFGAPGSCSGGGHPGRADVFFVYTSTVDGLVRIETCTPAGFVAGSLNDTILEVFDASACGGAGAAIACNDQSCGLLSAVEFTAVFGQNYLVRVATWETQAGFDGSFYLTVDASRNEACATAQLVAAGTVHGTTAGAAGSVVPSICAGVLDATPDVWYRVVVPYECDLTVAVSGAGADRLATYSGACGILALVDCDTNAANLAYRESPAPAGATRYFRVAKSSGATGAFALTVTTPLPPVNDHCGGAIAVFDGVNPAGPHGAVGQTFSNVGATSASGFGVPAPCAPFGSRSDVFFLYTSTCSGFTRVSTCAPAGFPAADYDTVLSVYPASACPGGSSAPLACNQDFGGVCSELLFPSAEGQSYLIRVASPNLPEDAEGAFRLTITPPFCLDMDAPNGPGSIRIRNRFGPPNAVAFTVLTLTAGTYPSAPFFGISPSVTEIVLQIASGVPPFVNVLDADGHSTFGPLLGAPTLTLYGVTFVVDAAGQIVLWTAPTSFQIP